MQKIGEYFPAEDFLIPKASRTFLDMVISKLIFENVSGCLKGFAIKRVMQSC